MANKKTIITLKDFLSICYYLTNKKTIVLMFYFYYYLSNKCHIDICRVIGETILQPTIPTIIIHRVHKSAQEVQVA